MRHLKGKSEFRAPKGSASQASAAAGSASRRETVHMEPFQDTSPLESTYDPADMSHLDTHMHGVMTLKWSDKQQRYHHAMGTSTDGTARPQTSTQCLTPRCRPRCSRCHRHLHKYHKDIHSSSIYNIHTSTSNRHLHSNMHQRISRSRARIHT